VIKPMLCHDAPHGDDGLPAVPTDEGWVIEKKLDGWRWIVRRGGGGVRCFGGRNGSEYSAPPLEAALAWLPPDTILDGELVTTEDGLAVSSALAHCPERLQYVVFDVLWLNGVDLCRKPWSQRRVFLEQMQDGFCSDVVASEVHNADPALHERWLAEGYEGSVAKRVTSVYAPGKRSWAWLKVKPQKTDEAVIVGFKDGKGALAGYAGAFEIRMLKSGALTSTATADDEQREAIKRDPASFIGKVIEVRHHGIFESGAPRHPIFDRMRPDRDPGEGPMQTPPKRRKKEVDVTAKADKAPARRQRNYRAMRDEKLQKVYAELRNGGDAAERCTSTGSGDLDADIATVEQLLGERGLVVR
jgi:ATP-dependent DNA ligase